MKTVDASRRRGRFGAAIASLLLVLSLATGPALPVLADNAGEGTTAFKERAAAEKSARSRFRRLEITSLVLILVAGGAVILWTVRRK
ncbi:MAG TPA: hypothetical protein VFU42_02010 [Candidatus Deferrimicrobiaceae bacterium]|nr:hypothetical protein [Candidatus Deferrimicrobiaceae bacterium]